MSQPPRPELVALLADVKENPDDLTPWLVLTDWLEENGDEADRARAEYCRLCFDKLGKKKYASDWERGERRRELFREYRERWFGCLAEWFNPFAFHSPRCQIQRGLVQVVTGFTDLQATLPAGWPGEFGAWVERLEVNSLDATQLINLARSPLLEGPAVVELHLFTANMGKKRLHEALRVLAESPYLGRVRELCLAPHGVLAVKTAVDPLKERFGKTFRMR